MADNSETQNARATRILRERALQVIAGRGCANYTGPNRCNCLSNGRWLAPFGAERMCDPCIAAHALAGSDDLKRMLGVRDV